MEKNFMGNILITTGPPTSGKTTYERAWIQEDPVKRKYAHTLEGARELLNDGYDVVIGHECFGSNNEITVKRFARG